MARAAPPFRITPAAPFNKPPRRRKSSASVAVLATDIASPVILRPYQQRWIDDPASLSFWIKAAQIGASFATAALCVQESLEAPKNLWILLSASERQSKELAEKCKVCVDMYRGVAAEYFPNVPFMETDHLQHELRFGNKSRIIALAANPDTARGYTGNVALDEFGFHTDSYAIFKAAYRQISLGYRMKAFSTPNGQKGKFFDIAKELRFDAGLRPARQPVQTRRSGWSGHWTDIHLAVEEGAPLDIEQIRAGCDDDTWAQEYCCHFVSQGSDWITPELFQSVCDPLASVNLYRRRRVLPDGALVTEDARDDGSFAGWHDALYAGWDIARKRDLSVIWFSELVGDVTWTRGVRVMRNQSTPVQLKEAASFMPLIHRLCVDQSAMGMPIYEALARQFPGKVEGVDMSLQRKEALAVLGRRRMEERAVRLPEPHVEDDEDDRRVAEEIRHAFRAIKKSPTQVSGHARFDADRDSLHGHADHWWAYCLAEAAADRRASSSLMDYGAFIGQERQSEFQPGHFALGKEFLRGWQQ